MPPIIERNVRPSENSMPSPIYGMEREMTSKSKSENIALFPAAAHVAGHTHPVLQRAHRDRDHQRDQHVYDGGYGENLESPEGVFGYLARLRRELEHADGERHRGVLE